MHDTARDLSAAALADARSLGCTCTPDITVDEPVPGWWTIRVAHDPNCPRLRPLHAADN